MRATWVCLSVSLPRQCVNYKKPRDDVHTHRVEMGLPSFISRQHNGKGERERKTGVSLFIFGIYQGDVLLLLLVCVCVICIFFRKGRYYWEFETFLSPLSARYFFMISFHFCLSSNPIRTRFVRAFWFFFSTFISSDSFLFISSAE